MKRALVTGGSGAIGSAICRALAENGCHVIIHANRNAEAAQRVADEITQGGGSAEIVTFDVTQAQPAQDALDRLTADHPIQILVNNAGIHDDAVFPGMAPAQWHRVIDVSLHGFFHVTHAVMMPMIRSRWGRIINVSSVAALSGNRGQVNYSAAKGALNSATKSLALEVASRGITVNAVAPGIIESEMASEAFDQDAINRMVPVKRAGKPRDVADLVAFLASDRAGYITGQIISVNGGLY